MSDPAKRKPSVPQRVIQELRDYAKWVVRTLGDPAVRDAVLADAGNPIVIKEGQFEEKLTFADTDPHFDGIDAYLKSVDPDHEAFVAAMADFKAIIAVVQNAREMDDAEFGGEFAFDAVMQVLTLNFLFRRVPAFYWIAQPLGLCADLFHTDPLLEKFGDGIVDFFKHEGGGPHMDTDFMAPTAVVASILIQTLELENVRLLYGWEGGPDSRTPVADTLSNRALSVAFDYAPKRKETDDATMRSSVTLTAIAVPASVGPAAVLFSIAGGEELEQEVIPGWLLKMKLGSAQAFDVYIPREGETRVNGPSDARAEISLERKFDPSEMPTVLPLGLGMRLEFSRALASVALSSAGFEARLATEKAAFVLESGGDPLVERGLKGGTLRTEFDLGFGYANGKLFLEGGAALQATVPVLKTIGPVAAKSLTLGLRATNKPEEPDLAFEVSVTFVATLGPVSLTLDRIGGTAKLNFGEKAKKSSPFDVDFQPPMGVGLSIETSAVEGGGYIFRDPAQDQYAGVIQLKLAKKIDVQATVLLTKRIDGKPAFSLLLIISAQFQPIPLAFGFKLAGVGGIFGVDRTINVPVLEAGVKTHALDALLFPNDPVKNAAQIVATAAAVFPPMRDRCIFGPMVRITWGSDQLVVFDLAVLLEFGSTLKRIAILGKARTHFPKPEKAVLKIEVDLVGTIDLDAKRVFAHAVITVGEIGAFKLSGAAAILYTWGANSTFVFSIGGFNPRFQPPQNFPELERVKFSLAKSSNLTVDASFYVAVTSNSFQIGGSLSLVAKKSKFALKGNIAIDALIQSQQPCYAFDLRSSLEVWVGSTPILSVRLNGTLLGDRPWTISGKATFEIWIFDYTIDFSHTWGSRDGADAGGNTIDIRPEVVAALSDRRNWTAALPAGIKNPVTLRKTHDTELRLSPLGTLTVTQRVVPLNAPLARVGNSRLEGQSLFTIDRLSVGGAPVKTEIIEESFAPAQYLDLSDDEKIGGPAFDEMQAGVRTVRDSGPVQGTAVPSGAEYRTKVYNPKTKRSEDLTPPAPLGTGVRFVLRPGMIRLLAAPRTKAVRLVKGRWGVAGIERTEAEPIVAAPATPPPVDAPVVIGPRFTATTFATSLHLLRAERAKGNPVRLTRSAVVPR